MDVKKLMAEGSLDNLSEDLFKSVSSYSEEVKAFQRQKAAEYADQVVAALKKIEQDIKDRYDRVGLTLEKRVLNIKDGKDGINGRDGRDGKDGKPGAAGLPGRDGKDGKNGRDGVDGKDGVSVINAFLDFDNSLVIELSNGKQVNAGAILGADFAEKVKIIANGGGTSQGVIDTLASLQAQIDAISSIGFVEYQGTWNASTNTPTITASVGTKGYYYVVSVAGTTSINGESKWGVGDWIVFNGSAWQKVDGGSTGNLTTLDVSGAAAIGGSLTLSGGSANSVTYLNSSKVLSTDGNLAFDGTSFSTGGSVYFSSNVGYYLYAGGNAGAQLKVLGYGSEGVAFKNYAGTTEYMRLDSTGLGIGTSSPAYKLDVAAAKAVTRTTSTTGTNGAFSIWANTGGSFYFGLDNSAGTEFSATYAGAIWHTGAYPLVFATSNTERMRLDSSGNLGIGTSSPGQKLEVAGAITSSGNLTAHQTSKAVIAFNSGNAEIRSYGAVGTVGRINFLQGSGGSAPTIAMSLDASGNLGIGTSSPAYKLDVAGVINSAQSATDSTIYVRNTATLASNRTAGLWFTNGGASVGASTRDYILQNIGTSASASDLAYTYWNGTSYLERIRLDSSGNLGLGVTPSGWATLKAFDVGTYTGVAGGNGYTHISNNAYLSTYASTWTYKNTNNASLYSMDSGTHKWYTAPSGTAGNAISFTQAMTLDASGNLGVGTTSPSPYTTNSKVVHIDGGANPAELKLTNNTSGASGATGAIFQMSSNNLYIWNAENSFLSLGTNNTERARIDSSGNLLIGKTSTANNDAGLRLFNDATDGGQIRFSRQSGSATQYAAYFYESGGGVVGSISTTSSTTAYNTSSDYRLKDNQQPLTNSGAFIDALQPKTWTWKADGSKGVGFIAHEVQAVSPGSVVGEKDAVDEEGKPIMQAMEYGSAEFIANIIAELQSLRKRVAELEAK